MTRLGSALADGAATVTGSNVTWVAIVAVVGVLALAMAGWLVRQVLAASQGTAKMQEIALAVQEGAAAYLRRQFRTLGAFVVLIFVVLLLLPADTAGVRWGRSLFFLCGARFSALTGFTGMSLAVRGNVRVAAAARESGERKATRIAFRTGGVAGMFTVGLGLVGKVEKGIPEDDPRNAATIADNVGDNVGDCAGMAADLFESYAVTLVAALILGSQAFGVKGLVFQPLIPAIGALTAVGGVYLTKPKAGVNGLTTINNAFYI